MNEKKKFIWKKGDVDKSQCASCSRFMRLNIVKDADGVYHGRCQAFPQGIPTEIEKNVVSHKKPYPGDNGIQYRKKGR